MGSPCLDRLAAAGFDAREVPVSRSAAQRRSRRLDKTDAVDAVASARALLAEPALGPVQALEVYDPLVAEIEAVLEHRRALAAARTLGLHHAADQISKPPAEIRDQLASVGKIEARLRRLEHIDPASATTPAGRYRLAQLQTFIDQDRQARHEIRRLERLINELLDQHGTTLRDEPGIGPISAASSKPLMHTGAGFALNFAAAVPPRAPLAQVTVTVVAAPTNNDTAALIFATNRSRAGHLSQPDTSGEFPTASCHGSSG